MVRGYRQLERNPEAELQLTHRRVRLYVGDNPVAGAVNAVAGTVEDGMVEHVEELRLELSLDPLRDGEVLKDRHIGPELARPGVTVALDVAERGNRRSAPTACTVAGIRQCWNWSEVHHLSGLIVEASRPHVE